MPAFRWSLVFEASSLSVYNAAYTGALISVLMDYHCVFYWALRKMFVFNLQKGKSGACLVWHQQCPTSSMLDHANVAICLPTLPLGYHVMMMFGEGQVMHLLGLTFHQELLISASITQHMAGGEMCVFVGVWVCADAWQMKGQHQLGPQWPARATSVVLCLELTSLWNSM